ncbi:MAG: hypothetical protein ABJE10_13715 [bacterium]
MDESLPQPQNDGALIPPPNVPPTAVATGEPPFRRPPRALLPAAKSDWIAMVNRALDKLDNIADRIADAAGLR